MPIYEYVCDQCGKEIEQFQRHYEDPPPVCPENEAHGPMRKKVSKANFKLEGGGWASDGYSH
jgi:putative FmdB family regulatory protein